MSLLTETRDGVTYDNAVFADVGPPHEMFVKPQKGLMMQKLLIGLNRVFQTISDLEYKKQLRITRPNISNFFFKDGVFTNQRGLNHVNACLDPSSSHYPQGDLADDPAPNRFIGEARAKLWHTLAADQRVGAGFRATVLQICAKVWPEEWKATADRLDEFAFKPVCKAKVAPSPTAWDKFWEQHFALKDNSELMNGRFIKELKLVL